MPQPIGFGTHLPPTHIESGGQGAPVEQSPATHMPFTHVAPSGQGGQLPLGTHAPF